MDPSSGTPKRQYGLGTASAMVVGIVIGSGIFFKTDNILVATGGNVALGVVVFCIAALSIIFGSLTISRLAAMTDKPGGAIAYGEEFVHPRFGSAFGWFQIFVYYPSLAVLISWVVGVYTCILFDLEMSVFNHFAIGISWFALCFAGNILSAKLGGMFQNAATLIKIVPLLIIGVLGFVLGKPGQAFSPVTDSGTGLGWVTAIGPIAFSFDGWIIATSIAHEVKDAKRNLPRALVLAPLFVLAGYLLYFVGVSAYVGPQRVLELGDGSVAYLAETMIGGFAAKAVQVFVVISVMGTVNGIVLGFIRLPYSLALRGMLPGQKLLTRVDKSTGTPKFAGLLAIVICAAWWVIHYIVTVNGTLGNGDISEISIVVTYFLYVVLYARVFLFWRKGVIRSVWAGVVFPALATLGSAFIVWGGLQNPKFWIFVGICAAVTAAGALYGRRNPSQVEDSAA